MRAPKELVPVLRAFVRFWQQPNGPVETHLRSLIEAVLLQGAKASNVSEDSILSRPPEMVHIPPPSGVFADPFSYREVMRKLLADSDLAAFRRYPIDVRRVRKARRAAYWAYLRRLDRDLRAAQKIREDLALRSADSELPAMLQESAQCFYHLNRLRAAAFLHWLHLPNVDLAALVQKSLLALEVRLPAISSPAEA